MVDMEGTGTRKVENENELIAEGVKRGVAQVSIVGAVGYWPCCRREKLAHAIFQ